MGGMGSAALKSFREGRKLTALPSIRAKCADCVCDYHDGRYDCMVMDCPLRPWMPYKGKIDPKSARGISEVGGDGLPPRKRSQKRRGSK